MNVKQKIKIIVVLVVLFLLPFLFSYFFESTFHLWNAQVNDLFFRLRYAIKGHEKIDPTLYFFTITDIFDQSYAADKTDRTIFASILEKLPISLFSLCVGDERGVPVEFISREPLKNNRVKDIFGFGIHPTRRRR